jgi:hypothetical protein
VPCFAVKAFANTLSYLALLPMLKSYARALYRPMPVVTRAAATTHVRNNCFMVAQKLHVDTPM